MASHLPEKQQKLALRLGIIGAYVFRGVSLALVVWIQGNMWIKYFGAGYLIYLMCSHLTTKDHTEEDALKIAPRGLWMTVASIELMDLSLSIDNVVAAVALSDKLWVIVTGVFIGILALRLLAGYAIGLIKKHPILSPTAFLLVGYVGCLLIFEMQTGIHLGTNGKFAGICLILIGALAYEHYPVAKVALGPLVKVSLVLMKIITKTVSLIFFPFTYLFGKLFHRAA
jgi:YkoY family integral membrane protein